MSNFEQSTFTQPLTQKYRPQIFNDIIYHQEVKQIIINSILTKKIPPAILFYGDRGAGKTTIARILAKSLNCLNLINGYEPCNQCENCLDIIKGTHPDILEIDAASKNSVDDIRDLIENAKYLPIKAAYKIYILDEVHMLSLSAFNALLKILEEPPHYVKFCLITTEYHKIPLTIISRCMRLNLRKIEVNAIKAQLQSIALQEHISIDERSAEIIAHIANGALRDAISLLDQAAILTDKHITSEILPAIIGYAENEEELIDLILAILSSHTEKALEITDNLYQKNIYLDLLFEKIMDLISELMIFVITKTVNGSNYLINVSGEKIEFIANHYNQAALNGLWEVFSKGNYYLKNNYYENHLNLFKITILKGSVTMQPITPTPKTNAQRSQMEIKSEPYMSRTITNIQKSPNRDSLLAFLKENGEIMLFSLINEYKISLNYDLYQIHDDNNLPAKHLQYLLKFLRSNYSPDWKIIYMASNESDNAQRQLRKKPVHEVKEAFCQDDLFLKLKAEFQIDEDDVRIIK